MSVSYLYKSNLYIFEQISKELIGKDFALQSGQKPRNLKFSQLTLESPSNKEPE